MISDPKEVRQLTVQTAERKNVPGRWIRECRGSKLQACLVCVQETGSRQQSWTERVRRKIVVEIGLGD